MRERIVDIYGRVINPPAYYCEVVELAGKMLDKMEEDNVDRADMLVVLNDLWRELSFHMTFYLDEVKKEKL